MFSSLANIKQKDVAVYVKASLNPTLLEADLNGRWIFVELDLDNQKTLLRGIHDLNYPTYCDKFQRKVKTDWTL